MLTVEINRLASRCIVTSGVSAVVRGAVVSTAITMASRGNLVSTLAERFEGESMSDWALYRVEHVAGKGLGCIAVKDIKRGSLVEREFPQLVIPLTL